MRSLAVVLALAFLTAPVAAQTKLGTPYLGCEARAHECDPVAANGGDIKGGDEPVRVILYGHFKDMLQRAPLNTQAPHPEHEQDINRGFLMPTLYTTDQRFPCCKFQNNQLVMTGSPGPVEYMADGNWRVHQGPILGKDLEFASSYLTGLVYLSPGQSGPIAQTPGVMPSVGVHMRLVLGNFVDRWADVTIAEGDTGTGYGQKVPNGGHAINLVSLPGEDPVYEFRVQMPLWIEELPASHRWTEEPWGSYVTLIATPYQFESQSGGFTQQWSWRTGYRFPPRLIVDVVRPLEAEEIAVDKTKDGLTARWNVTTAFGAYDVARQTIQASLQGPSPLDVDFVGARMSIMCHGELEPVRATWRIPLREAADGTYTLRVSALNAQRTYQLTEEVTFDVRSGRVILASETALSGEATLPGFNAILVLIAVFSIVATRRLR